MARIRHMTQTYSRRVNTFLGVNEAPDGDNGLKPGEAEYMRNWRVTMDGKLKLRPGSTPSQWTAEKFSSAYPVTAFGPIRALWSGYVSGDQYVMVVSNGHLYVYGTYSSGDGGAVLIANHFGNFTDGPTTLFEFQNKIYILTGQEYLCWEPPGIIGEVEGYVPVVVTACPPAGGGTELEGANLLTPKRRVQFSPDGKSTAFSFPEMVDYIEDVRYTGGSVSAGFDPEENALVFDTAPKKGTNTLEVTYRAVEPADSVQAQSYTASNVSFSAGSSAYIITASISGANPLISFHNFSLTEISYNGGANATKWDYLAMTFGATYKMLSLYNSSDGKVYINMVITIPKDDRITITSVESVSYSCSVPSRSAASANRALVTGMRYSALYNGYTDSRVFLYGDGSYTAIYSGLDEYGAPRADYFPALNQMNVGSANTPIKSMCRHYGALLCFKEGEAYRISYDSQTIADGRVIAGFNIRPMNSAVGSAGYNQAVLVNNNPRTLHQGSVFEWRLNYYGGGSLRDERNAKRISDRVLNTIKGMDLSRCVTYDDEANYEYWITDPGLSPAVSIVNNYGNDTWYVYTGISATCFLRYKGKLYYGTAGGVIYELTESSLTHETGAGLNAQWRSGSFDGGHDYVSKWVIDTYLGLGGENSACKVGLVTDRRWYLTERTVYRQKLQEGYETEDGAEVATNDYPDTPTMHHIKSRAKGWAFLKTELTNVSGRPCTVVSLDTLYRLGTNGRRV